MDNSSKKISEKQNFGKLISLENCFLIFCQIEADNVINVGILIKRHFSSHILLKDFFSVFYRSFQFKIFTNIQRFSAVRPSDGVPYVSIIYIL